LDEVREIASYSIAREARNLQNELYLRWTNKDGLWEKHSREHLKWKRYYEAQLKREAERQDFELELREILKATERELRADADMAQRAYAWLPEADKWMCLKRERWDSLQRQAQAKEENLADTARLAEIEIGIIGVMSRCQDPEGVLYWMEWYNNVKRE
jgi:hypothetical protein